MAIRVRVVRKTSQPLPAYETEDSAGMDLRAEVSEPVVMEPGARALIPTGLFLEIPVGYEGQVRPRSGLALKRGLTVLNAAGTIDADYRGDVGVLLINHGREAFTVEDGMRVAQMVVARYSQFEWESVEDLDETARGAGGFGSTGKQ